VSVYYQDEQVTLRHGHVFTVARELPAGSVNCIVASPPFYGFRDCGVEGQYVLDPFGGSGTTGLAAQRAGHRYIGIDLPLCVRVWPVGGGCGPRNSRSGVGASCRCRDMAVTRGRMGSHDYLKGGGLPGMTPRRTRQAVTRQLNQQLDRGF
jgi:hypothetical protein